MNETIKTILSRRSIRSYLPEQIKDEELDLIIKSGLHAPSGHNSQSWNFTVIQDKELINKLNISGKEKMSECEDEYVKTRGSDENYNLFYKAPTIIIISGETSTRVPQIDCAAATQNMLIAAESLNIGTCWIGLIAYLFRSDKVGEFIKLFEIPEGHNPYYAITVGYKAEGNQPAAPRKENTVNYKKISIAFRSATFRK